MSKISTSYKLFVPLCLSLMLVSGVVHSANAPVIEQVAEEPRKVLSSKEDYVEAVYYFAEQYNVSAERMIATMNCENRDWNPLLQSRVIQGDGTREKSWGLSQIHLPSNLNVTLEQATDPEFSIEFMAKAFSKGQQNKWSCYRKLYN